MNINDLLEMLLEGRIRLKIEWDKIPIKCPYCEWSSQADMPKQADLMLKEHIRTCPKEPIRTAFMSFLDE